MSDKNAKELKGEYEDLLRREKEIDEELKKWEKKSVQKYEMSLLHKYNEVKDAAQTLLGTVANIEGITSRKLHERFHLPLND